jgi:hypothetical protein
VKAVAAELILLHTKSPPNAKNKNPVAERNFGTLEPGIRATLCYAHAPECLWPWAAAHIERVLYFLPSRAHEPIQSAYHFTHPDAGDADLAWAKPLFCDVTVVGHRRAVRRVGTAARLACPARPRWSRAPS